VFTILVVKVKNKRYVQYKDFGNCLIHCGPANKIDSWRLAFTLLDEDLDIYQMSLIWKYLPIWVDEFKPNTRDERSKLVNSIMRTFTYRENMPDCLRKAKETQRISRRDWKSLAKDIHERTGYILVDKFQQPLCDPDASNHVVEE